jgi:polygalacturonase
MTSLMAALCCCTFTAAELVVTPEQFGAIGDGKANDWRPVQRALTACATAVDSCRIKFSRKYLSGPLIINTSRMTLEVASGSILAMLPKPDYEKACPQTGCPFLSTAPGAEGCRTVYPNPHVPADGYQVCLRDVTITGGGTIDGGATWDPSSWWLCARLVLKCWRPKLTYFSNVTGLTINGSLTMKDAPTGFVRLSGNVGTRISGLTLSAPYLTPNTDGINVYGGFDTLLEDSIIDNGDDCVSIVPAGEWIENGDFCYRDPSNVVCSGGHSIVRNFTCNGGHGLSIGGIRHGTVTNVTFSHIVATGGQPGSTQDEEAGGGCRVKSRPNSTGIVTGIRYEDMTFKDVYWPLQLLGHYCPFPCRTPDGNTTTLFTNVSFERVRGSSRRRSLLPSAKKTTVAQFKCSKSTPCAHITMRSVTLTDRDGRPGLLECENVASVSIDNASSPGVCG